MKQILIIVFGQRRGHSRDLAEEVKSSQVDTGVSDVSVLWHWWLCEDSGENAALRWGKEGILPRHSRAMSPEEFPLRMRLNNTWGVGGNLLE